MQPQIIARRRAKKMPQERRTLSNLRDSLRECKLRLPLPELARLLCPGWEPKRSCQSPFREDRNPSFSIFQQDGLWFWRDHALRIGGDEIDFLIHGRGCDKDDAIRAYHELAGVSMPQKQRRRDGAHAAKLIATYDYLSADGKLVHQTLRYEPKRFLQRRPAAPGMRAGNKIAKSDREGKWWLWTLHGIEPVLYHLPQIVGGNPEAPVYLCEGEKDADALATAWNVLTTTAPMGAGKWRPSYTETLRDRDVIIWPDRDPAGEKHMACVAQALYPVANRLRIMDWAKLWPGPLRIQRARSTRSTISKRTGNEQRITSSQGLHAAGAGERGHRARRFQRTHQC
jgi:putative DNA primase/helicase